MLCLIVHHAQYIWHNLVYFAIDKKSHKSYNYDCKIFELTFCGVSTGGGVAAKMGVASYIDRQALAVVLAAMTPPNRRVMRLCLACGLRVNDALSIRADKLRRRMYIRESKTGKSKRITIPAELYDELERSSGRLWVFEGRCDPKRHRTRQAVWKDCVRAAKALRCTDLLPPGAQISPHTARKIAAVEAYEDGGLDAARKLLNHSTESREVTLIYAMADKLTADKSAAIERRRKRVHQCSKPQKPAGKRSAPRLRRSV